MSSESSHGASDEARRARVKFLVLMVLFAAPVLLAASAYYWSWPFSPAADSRGELLMPVRPLANFTAESGASQPLTNDDLHGLWWMLVVGDARCDLFCEADLFKARQVRHAVGRDSARVRTAYVTSADAAEAPLRDVLRRHPETLLILKARELASSLSRRGIYIVDPNGNAVLFYERAAKSKDIRRDLRRLLKVSRIG